MVERKSEMCNNEVINEFMFENINKRFYWKFSMNAFLSF